MVISDHFSLVEFFLYIKGNIRLSGKLLPVCDFGFFCCNIINNNFLEGSGPGSSIKSGGKTHAPFSVKFFGHTGKIALSFHPSLSSYFMYLTANGFSPYS